MLWGVNDPKTTDENNVRINTRLRQRTQLTTIIFPPYDKKIHNHSPPITFSQSIAKNTTFFFFSPHHSIKENQNSFRKESKSN